MLEVPRELDERAELPLNELPLLPRPESPNALLPPLRLLGETSRLPAL
jgi:hypothetical protein